MKKIVFLTLIAFISIGVVFGQARDFRRANPALPETVQLEGTLQLQNGHIVLSTGTAEYFIPGLMRYIGFIDGLKEGARITAEGYAFRNFLHTTKLTIDGREYDFAVNPGWRQMGSWGPMGGQMGHHFHNYGGHRRGRW